MQFQVTYIEFDFDNEDEWFYHEQIADLNDSGYTFTELSKIIQEQF